MEEKEIEVNDKTLNIGENLPVGYIEDNNLKIFLDDTIDLGEVVGKIENTLTKEDTDEINLNE